MTKLLAVLYLFLALYTVSTQSCDYTANLRDYYGFSNSLTTAKTYSDIKYCNDIKNGAVCCTDTDINSIAQISSDYVSNLTTLVSSRDLYLKNVKDNVLPNLITNIKKFNTVAQQFATNFENEMANAGGQDLGSEYQGSGSEYQDSGSDYQDSGSDYQDSGSDYQDLGSEYQDSGSDGLDSGSDNSGDTGSTDITSVDILDYFTSITNMTYSFISDINTITANYGNYQTARRTCVIEMMDLQNAALCLSCDPSAQDKGFTDFGNDEFGFTMADSVCQRLQTNCKPYIAAAVGQNQIIEAVYASALISGLTTAMEDFNNGNYDTALIDFMTVLNDTSSMPTVDAIALIDASLPVDCDTNGNCEWICDGLFMNGLVDPIALIAGGEYDIYSTDGQGGFRRRRLSENRRLDTGEWTPAENESGVTVNFAVDPANTNPNSTSTKFGSLNLGNIVIGMMVVISSILLL